MTMLWPRGGVGESARRRGRGGPRRFAVRVALAVALTGPWLLAADALATEVLRAYSGPERPKSELSLIVLEWPAEFDRGGLFGSLTVALGERKLQIADVGDRVDGARRRAYVEVLAGKQSIVVDADAYSVSWQECSGCCAGCNSGWYRITSHSVLAIPETPVTLEAETLPGKLYVLKIKGGGRADMRLTLSTQGRDVLAEWTVPVRSSDPKALRDEKREK